MSGILFFIFASCEPLTSTLTPRGYSHVKVYMDVLYKWVSFSQEILRHRSHFRQKNSLEVCPISQKLQKKKKKKKKNKPFLRLKNPYKWV